MSYLKFKLILMYVLRLIFGPPGVRNENLLTLRG
jgi:hypothetical protein